MFANDTGELEQYDMRYSPSSQEQHAAQSPTAAEPPASQSSRGANPLYRDQSDEFQKYNAGALTASGPITQALPHEMQGKHGGHKHTKEPLSSESSEDPMFLEGLSTSVLSLTPGACVMGTSNIPSEVPAVSYYNALSS